MNRNYVELSSDLSSSGEIDVLSDSMDNLVSPSKCRTTNALSDDELVDYFVRKERHEPEAPLSRVSYVPAYSEPHDILRLTPFPDLHSHTSVRAGKIPKDKDESLSEMSLVLSNAWLEGNSSIYYSSVSLGLLLIDELKSRNISYEICELERPIDIYHNDTLLPSRLLFYKQNLEDFITDEESTIVIYKHSNRPNNLDVLLISNPRLFPVGFSSETKLVEWIIQFLRSLSFLPYRYVVALTI